jgi:hypothetical protein
MGETGASSMKLVSIKYVEKSPTFRKIISPSSGPKKQGKRKKKSMKQVDMLADWRARIKRRKTCQESCCPDSGSK